jgi:hypothetical protein
VLVLNNQPPRYIPTPSFIANAATNPTNAKAEATTANTAGAVRSFAPGDVAGCPRAQANSPLVGDEQPQAIHHHRRDRQPRIGPVEPARHHHRAGGSTLAGRPPRRHHAERQRPARISRVRGHAKRPSPR